MSQTVNRPVSADLESGQNGVSEGIFQQHCSPVDLAVERELIVDGHRDQPQSALAQKQPSSSGQLSPGELGCCDSSWPLFSMYSKLAEEEDSKLTERYQKGTDGILIFVSTRLGFHVAAQVN